MRFFQSVVDEPSRAAQTAAIVFSWLARRGQDATRLDPRDVRSPGELRRRLHDLFAADDLFVTRIDQR
jgi:hypothetical protein